jgi:hypothetical protein
MGVPERPYPPIHWDNNRPIVLATSTTGSALVRCDIDAGTCAPVRTIAGTDRESGTSWSEDGTHVTFWRSRCLKWEPNQYHGGTYCTRYSNDLRLLDVQRGQEISVLSNVSGTGGGDLPVFAPHGRHIAFTAGFLDRPSTYGLFVHALP